ncbi:AAA family ATPase [mine drainage metagenome]|uniref:AAA family ATPase n=1 Tax=mine drainage metagenome TaxID=410659 RepID=T1BNU0_9ZZZZ
MNDESVKSSLQPDHIVFHEYSSDEIREILKMRADEGLNRYDKESLGLLSAMLVRDYRSDARIGIKALEIIGRLNKWDDDSVRASLKQAYVEVEGETLKNLGDRDLLILAALIKNQDTNRAYSEVSASGNMLLRGVSKSTFFQSVNYLQNLGLITLIKKKIGRYYTMESQILLSMRLLYLES